MPLPHWGYGISGFSPISIPFHTFLLISTMDFHTLVCGRGYKTTPKWGIKPPPTPFLAIFDPWGGFMPPGGGFIPPFAGVGLSPKGVVLSPHLVIGGVLSPLWGGFIPHFW